MRKIKTGAWRHNSTGPMQVVSGPLGHEQVHFEAPPAARLDREMWIFLAWFNAASGIDPVLKAGLAHLWFVTIQPFDDGNGRIARAIADMTLARSENSSQRFYSMSAQIREERSAYYGMLEQTQKGTMDVTAWLAWFLGCLRRAIEAAQSNLTAVLAKARFWERLQSVSLNDRQRLVLNRLLDGPQRAGRGPQSAQDRLPPAATRLRFAGHYQGALRASSQRRSMRSSPSVPRTPRCATFCRWWNAASLSAIRQAAAAPVMRLRRINRPDRARTPPLH